MSQHTEQFWVMDRREAIKRVSALLGGVALVGGSALLTGCRDDRTPSPGADSTAFSTQDVAFLDEIADTILPDTARSPGAKAAQVGAFMALMVKDTYDARDQRVFRDGMRALDEASRAANQVGFVQATPAQRLALLERLDREQKAHTDAREAARSKPVAAAGATPEQKAADTSAAQQVAEEKAAARLPDQRQEAAATQDVASGATITADTPAHYFRMMKELALLGYFTSEIGYTKAMRYVESPGRFEPCVPYTAGEPAWAPHA